MKKKNIIISVLVVILAVILILVGIVLSIAKKNVASMNRCIDIVIEELNKNYTVTALDTGEYKEMKLYGIVKFNIEQFDVEGLGNLSVMRVNMGVMQMATAIITPQNKNLPLFSIDYLYMLSNRKAYLEFYDVVKEKDEQYMQLMDNLDAIYGNYNHLENFEPSKAWYDNLITVASFKNVKADADADLDNMLKESLKVYIEHSKAIPELTEEEKEEKLAITKEYTDGLVDNGGVSVSIFKKQLGTEETRKFLDRVLFGTDVK